MASADITWMSTADAAARLGIGARTLYRLIDLGELPAYKFGRVIRLQAADVDEYINHARIKPGTLEHLYPEPRPREGQAAPAVEDEDEDEDV